MVSRPNNPSTKIRPPIRTRPMASASWRPSIMFRPSALLYNIETVALRIFKPPLRAGAGSAAQSSACDPPNCSGKHRAGVRWSSLVMDVKHGTLSMSTTWSVPLSPPDGQRCESGGDQHWFRPGSQHQRTGRLIADITGKKINVLHNHEQSGGVSRLVANVQRARQLLNWTPNTSLSEGLSWTLMQDARFRPAKT